MGRVMLAIFVVMVLVTGVVLLRQFDPNQPGNPFPGCFFREWTGFFCPNCGITRALHALVHADPVTALRMNALAMLGLPIAAPLLYRLHKPLPDRLERILAPIAKPWLWLGIYLGFGLLRNLPWVPFVWLAPPG